MEKLKLSIVITLLLIGLVACKQRNEKFDKRLWSERTDMFYDHREKMVVDLMENYLQKGMTYSTLIELIGEPENYAHIDSNTIGYEIMVDYGWNIDPIEEKTLLIELSNDSTIVDFRLKSWKK
ncbi:hypothetical protein DMA11_08630 [Marinilabiliaceae bacterium JC017]|nr:hypothetical protein DMA11_08630 [Marinilabiliaceae bacterium JC017]